MEGSISVRDHRAIFSSSSMTSAIKRAFLASQKNIIIARDTITCTHEVTNDHHFHLNFVGGTFA